MATIGLVAGGGGFPIEIARAARASGHRVAVVGLEGLVPAEMEAEGAVFQRFPVGQLAGIFAFLREAGARNVLMAGKFHKDVLSDLSIVQPDETALRLLGSITSFDDDALLKLVADAIEEAGFRVSDQAAFTPGLLGRAGPIGAHGVEPEDRADIVFGWRAANGDDGQEPVQTVVVGEGVVYARESSAHTDDAIRRGCAEARGKVTRVVKVKRPDQDLRFDLPTIGPNTIETMLEGGARLLAVEADVTVVLEREALVALANREGIAVVAVDAATIDEWADE